jgi:phosphopantetheine--protein transferase-like protein
LPEILGIGTDLEETRRFQKHITAENTISNLIEDVFTGDEIARNLSFKNPYICFALGFCCKESMFKALGKSWMNAPITWQETELLLNGEPEEGSFEIRLSGGILELYNELGGSKIEGEFNLENDHVVFRVILWK